MALEPRKLIKFGNSSYVISLPKEWLERNNLKKGDIIYLENENGELKLRGKDREKIPKAKKIVIDITNQEFSSVRREINSAYVNNANFFVVTGTNPKIKIEDIKGVFDELVGLEVIDQTNNEMLVRDFLDLETISPKKIVRRIDNIIRSMFEDIKFVKGSFRTNQVKEILEADRNINRLYFLVSRIVKKGLADASILPILEMNYEEISSTHWLVMNLEYMGDEIKRLARYFLETELSESQKKNINQILNEIEELYTAAMGGYYNNNKDGARLALNKRQWLLKQCETLGKGSKEVVIGQIIEKLKGICFYTTNISRLIVY